MDVHDERRARNAERGAREARQVMAEIMARYNRTMAGRAPGTPMAAAPVVIEQAECGTCGGTGVILGRDGLPKDCPQCGGTRVRDARLAAVKRWSSSNGRSSRQSFENFETAGSSIMTLALREARAWADGTGKRFLVLWGSPGVGKSHLAAAAINVRLARGELAYYVTAPDLLSSLKDTFKDNPDEDSFAERMARYQSVPVLALDDFGSEKVSDWTEEVWFMLLNYRWLHELPTLITSNLSLSIEDAGGRFDRRILDRLNDRELARVIEMVLPSHRTGVLL